MFITDLSTLEEVEKNCGNVVLEFLNFDHLYVRFFSVVGYSTYMSSTFDITIKILNTNCRIECECKLKDLFELNKKGLIQFISLKIDDSEIMGV